MITRFAPSPSGYLHLGHAYAALIADHWGRQMILRHEDIDQAICRPEFAQQIEADLDWLGMAYRWPSSYQTARYRDHKAALDRLIAEGFCYPCFCGRGDIRRAAQAPHAPEGIYPGTCRHLSPAQQAEYAETKPYAYRLDMAKALEAVGAVSFVDRRFGQQNPDARSFGDVVIGRKHDMISYHLAVVWDDAADWIDLVTRGEDLLPLTGVQVVLQRLLGLPTPEYLHHHLLTDENGVRLAKRADAYALKQYREDGRTPEDVLSLLPTHAEDLP